MASSAQPLIPPPAPQIPWWVVPSFVWIVLFIFFVALAAAIYRNDQDNLKQLIIAVVGWGGLGLGFYLASSSSSQKKDEVSAAQNAQALTALATSAPVDTVPSDAAKAAQAALAGNPVPTT